MNLKQFFTKLYERLEIGRLTPGRRLILFLRRETGAPTIQVYYLAVGLHRIYKDLMRRRSNRTRHALLTTKELRYIRFQMTRFLWREMRSVVINRPNFDREIVERDCLAAEEALDLFRETFAQICSDYSLPLKKSPSTRTAP